MPHDEIEAPCDPPHDADADAALEALDPLWRDVLACGEALRHLGFEGDELQLFHGEDTSLCFILQRNGRSFAVKIGRLDASEDEIDRAALAARAAWAAASPEARERLRKASLFQQGVDQFQRLVEELELPSTTDSGVVIEEGRVRVRWQGELLPVVDQRIRTIPPTLLRLLLCHEILGSFGFEWFEIEVCTFDDLYVGIIARRGLASMTMEIRGDQDERLETIVDGRVLESPELDEAIGEASKVYREAPRAERERVARALGVDAIRTRLRLQLAMHGLDAETLAQPVVLDDEDDQDEGADDDEDFDEEEEGYDV